MVERMRAEGQYGSGASGEGAGGTGARAGVKG